MPRTLFALLLAGFLLAGCLGDDRAKDSDPPTGTSGPSSSATSSGSERPEVPPPVVPNTISWNE